MRTPVIRLIDLGYDDGFGKAMTFAQSLLSSINVSGPRADIEYIRTSDWKLVARAFAVPARLIHVMSHGYTTDDNEPAFGAVDEDGDIDSARAIRLREIAAYLQRGGEGIEANGVFADCCGSAQERFKAALRDSLETEIVYIGASRSVDWHECTTFASILYGSLLRAKGRGFDALDWVYTSAEMSVDAYSVAVDGRCPFKVTTLAPSRSAKKAFANAKRGMSLP